MTDNIDTQEVRNEVDSAPEKWQKDYDLIKQELDQIKSVGDLVLKGFKPANQLLIDSADNPQLKDRAGHLKSLLSLKALNMRKDGHPIQVGYAFSVTSPQYQAGYNQRLIFSCQMGDESRKPYRTDTALKNLFALFPNEPDKVKDFIGTPDNIPTTASPRRGRVRMNLKPLTSAPVS